MKVSALLLAAACVCGAAYATPATTSAPAAREAAIALIRRVVDAVQQPAGLSIGQLSRQLRFNYDQVECLDTDTHVAYCEYFPKGLSDRAGVLGTIALGRDRITGRIGGSLSWQRADDRMWLRKKDIARVLGPGTRPATASVPWVPPVPEMRPAPVDELEYNAIPAARPTISVRATYQHQCLVELLLDF